MTGDTDRRERRRWSGWDDIVQFEWNDLLEDTPINDLLVDTPINDLLVIDDQTREVLDSLGHDLQEDIMQLEWDDFPDDPQAAVIADEEVERPVRRR
jgi:hypothetical protein